MKARILPRVAALAWIFGVEVFFLGILGDSAMHVRNW